MARSWIDIWGMIVAVLGIFVLVGTGSVCLGHLGRNGPGEHGIDENKQSCQQQNRAVAARLLMNYLLLVWNFLENCTVHVLRIDSIMVCGCPNGQDCGQGLSSDWAVGTLHQGPGSEHHFSLVAQPLPDPSPTQHPAFSLPKTPLSFDNLTSSVPLLPFLQTTASQFY